MLILNRKPGESIIIDDKIEVTILEVQDGRVKLGIEAPKSISILRKEVYEEVVEANRKSLEVEIDVMDFLKKIK
ncbi:MAG: carbon storage regulator CsrA [Tissierellaceae bacterium]|jgi:carbon storage regulator